MHRVISINIIIKSPAGPKLGSLPIISHLLCTRQMPPCLLRNPVGQGNRRSAVTHCCKRHLNPLETTALPQHTHGHPPGTPLPCGVSLQNRIKKNNSGEPNVFMGLYAVLSSWEGFL